MKFLIVLLLLCGVAAAAAPADLVLKNGTITTMEKSMPQASAIAITGDKISWVGDTKDADQWIGKSTKVIDLKGGFVYPGFIESHIHITSLGSSRLEIDLNETPNKETIAKLVKEKVAKSKKGEWIQGRGWDQNLWPEKVFPTVADLDTVSPDNPVVLERTDGHAVWINSAALKIAGINATTTDPDGGKIVRDDQGNATGVLIDNAMDLITSKMKALTPQEEMQRTNIVMKEALQKGVTMMEDAGSSQADVQTWKAMSAKDQLPARIYVMVWMPSEFGESFLKTGPEMISPYLTIRAIKMVLDGAMGSRGAALLEPYSDDPKNTGLLMWKDPEFSRVLRAAKEKHIQVNIHAIGDRANRIVLDHYEELEVKNLRWRIEHAQLLAPSDIPRFAKIGVIASMQPIHATADMVWTPDRVGQERVKGSYAWRSLLDAGAIIAGGSDAPVEDMNPLWGIYAAITRQDQEGHPEGGWHPEQLVSREEALAMYTTSAAYAAFRENELGSLAVGKLADMVVLPENLLTCDAKHLVGMKVTKTIVGGKVRFDSLSSGTDNKR